MKSPFRTSNYVSIDCVKHVYIELYTWTSIRQSFFANNSGNAVSPNFLTAKVSYYTVGIMLTVWHIIIRHAYDEKY